MIDIKRLNADLNKMDKIISNYEKKINDYERRIKNLNYQIIKNDINKNQDLFKETINFYKNRLIVKKESLETYINYRYIFRKNLRGLKINYN